MGHLWHPRMTAYWPFDGGGVDASGNGHHLANDGSTAIDGVYGQARSFDGLDDSMQAQAAAELSGFDDFTIAFWAKMDVLPTSGANYVASVFGGDGERAWAVVARGGQSQWSLFASRDGLTNDTNVVTIPFSGVTAGQWHHYAFRRIGGTAAALLDGVVISAALYEGTIFASPANLWLSGNATETTSFLWSGQLDEGMIFSQDGLSTDDINRLLNNFPPEAI